MDGRSVTVVVLDATRELLGVLPSFDVGLPYWQETRELVTHVRDLLGAEVDVLRLLGGDRPVGRGGHVTYLAQMRTGCPHRPTLQPVIEDLAAEVWSDQPLRMPYARPDGPARTLAWAEGHLPDGTAMAQERTWNLSAIWQVRDAESRTVAWLKQVPPFFSHEDTALRWVAGAVPGAVPELLAADDAPDTRRLLLAALPGADLYESPGPVRARILALAELVHVRSRDAAEDLVAVGVPDRRGQRLAGWIRTELAGHLAGHPAAALVDELPERMDEVTACGVPDVLVHGDLHPGNAIGDAERLALLDWGDCFLGHPGFDALRLTDGLRPEEAGPLLAQWAEGWRRRVRGSDPARSLDLIRTVEPLRAAAVYAAFLARIEPSERVYHRADVPQQLDRAVQLAS